MKIIISLLALCFLISGCCIFKPPKRWSKDCQTQTESVPAVKETQSAQVQAQKSVSTVAEPAMTAPEAAQAAPAVEQVKGEIISEDPKPAAVIEEKKPEIIKGEVVE